MYFSNLFIISCRASSMILVTALGLLFAVDSFSFKSIFIGLLFSHFAMGFYYSKNNITLLREKKSALIIASIVLLIGLYFSLFVTYLAPYFLIVHAALSDAYLLKTKSKNKNDERLSLLRTVFYSASASVVFIGMPLLIMNIFLVIGLVSLIFIIYDTKDKISLCLFELPLVALVFSSQINQTTFHIHYLGFYHIATWYVFSFWMLFVKEKNISKTITFFSKIAILSVAFILVFNNLLNYTITEKSFLRIIGIWSILHIFSSIPLSKFNPSFLKDLFYISK